MALTLGAVAWPRNEEIIAPLVKKQSLPEVGSDTSLGTATPRNATWDIEVDVVRARNPFARPAFLQPQVVQDISTKSPEARISTVQVRVDAVLATSGAIAAIVNGRVVRLGDRVDERRRVLAISHDTITIGDTD